MLGLFVTLEEFTFSVVQYLIGTAAGHPDARGALMAVQASLEVTISQLMHAFVVQYTIYSTRGVALCLIKHSASPRALLDT